MKLIFMNLYICSYFINRSILKRDNRSDSTDHYEFEKNSFLVIQKEFQRNIHTEKYHSIIKKIDYSIYFSSFK